MVAWLSAFVTYCIKIQLHSVQVIAEPRKFGNHVTVHRTSNERPSVRTTGKPMFTPTLSSWFGSPGEN